MDFQSFTCRHNSSLHKTKYSTHKLSQNGRRHCTKSMLIVTIVSRDLPLMTETSTRQNCFARGASTKSSSNKVLVASWMQSCHLLRHHRQARRHKCRPVRNTSMSARTNLRFASHGMLLYASLDLHPCRLGIGV